MTNRPVCIFFNFLLCFLTGCHGNTRIEALSDAPWSERCLTYRYASTHDIYTPKANAHQCMYSLALFETDQCWVNASPTFKLQSSSVLPVSHYAVLTWPRTLYTELLLLLLSLNFQPYYNRTHSPNNDGTYLFSGRIWHWTDLSLTH